MLASAAALVAACATPASALTSCADSSAGSSGWCQALHFASDVPDGELGFRFGEPMDLDGDGHPDVAAGARWKLVAGVFQNGCASVWSGVGGARMHVWDGNVANGMFGQSVLPVRDLDGDGVADLIISAPNATLVDNELHGIVFARSVKSERMLWAKVADREENLGWDLAPAGDQNADGAEDVFAGAPSQSGGRVLLLSGKDGSVLRSYEPPNRRNMFGWYVAKIDDVDGDGHADLLVGDLQGEAPPVDPVSEVYLFSGATGALLRSWKNPDHLGSFGQVVAGVGDMDGDGIADVAVGASADQSASDSGDVEIFSSKSGALLRHWTGSQRRELYGRMVTSVGDINGDGTDDVAIGAPWYAEGQNQKVGRVEIRSGKSGEVLANWTGDGAESWFGWHIRRAPDPEGKNRPALLIGSLRQPVDEIPGVGVIDWIVRR